MECPTAKHFALWFKRGLPQPTQVNHSIDAKFSNSLVRPVYLLSQQRCPCKSGG